MYTICDMAFSEETCFEVIMRAQKAIEEPKAVADINRRLGTRVSSIPLGITYCAGLDGDQKTGSQYPVMWLANDALSYLGLHPNIEGVQFRWILGVWNDRVIGPIPVFFMGTRNQDQERLFAALWPLTKCGDAKWANQESAFMALKRESLEMPNEIGLGGGLLEISEIGIVIQRSTGGLDLKTTNHFIPLKFWRTLEWSIKHNAVADAFAETAPTWPFTHEIDSLFESKGMFAAGFQFWY